jgi:hypothetical protein
MKRLDLFPETDGGAEARGCALWHDNGRFEADGVGLIRRGRGSGLRLSKP